MGHFKEIENGRETLFSNCWVTNLLFERTSFLGMLSVILSEPPFRDQPYAYWPACGVFISMRGKRQ